LALANQGDRVLITKDTDSEVTSELGQGPPKLLLITTGNIHNVRQVPQLLRGHFNPGNPAEGITGTGSRCGACLKARPWP
jgi:hypothetical protein